MELKDLLSLAVREGASDVHLKAGIPPVLRKNGQLFSLANQFPVMEAELLHSLAVTIMPALQREQFEQNREADFSYGISGVGRFRVNVSRQRDSTRLVFRSLASDVPSLDSLSLPPVMKQIAQLSRGLVLITGTTGSGKSTTMAAVLDYINTNLNRHIITIEDPIEYIIPDRKSLITQRELGTDTDSFAVALRAALRQDPDVIMIGEMRDLETINVAMLAAETGHLVISTLHTTDALESINRIIGVYPEMEQAHVRLQLANSLAAIVSQRLARRSGDRGRVPAVEVILQTPRVREMIADPAKTRNLLTAIEEGYDSYGMQSFDQSLMQLMTQKLIDKAEALRLSTNPGNFELRLKGLTSMGGQKWSKFDLAKDDPFSQVTNVELEDPNPDKPRKKL